LRQRHYQGRDGGERNRQCREKQHVKEVVHRSPAARGGGAV
jgi:hypothetical protein